MTPVIAAFFESFLVYMGLGVLALVVTAGLDRAIGRERALLLWALGLLGVTMLLRPTVPPARSVVPQALKLPGALDPSAPVEFAGEIFSREPLATPSRNPFEEQSDTSALPPEALRLPPDVALAFPLPPTVPGAGPAARHVYRGSVPEVKTGDGTALPEVPADAFAGYEAKPEDVFDWIMAGGQRQYVYLREIDGAKEGSEEFEGPRGLKWNLALREGPPAFPKPWQGLRVTFAFIGTEDAAKKEVATIKRARNLRVSSILADEHERWYLRRTVANLFEEACRAAGAPRPEDLSIEGLKQVAAAMTAVGESGKEDGAGWRRAIQALELALAKSEASPGRDPSDVLVPLLAAYRAVHDERMMLSTLAHYLRANRGGAALAEGTAWLGEVMLRRLGLPDRAEAVFDRALSAQPGARKALLGRGDARFLRGDLAGALEDYRTAAAAGAREETAVREAEALLAAGDLAAARSAADAALAVDAFDPRALNAKGAALYALGDLQGARDAFAQAAALPGEGAAGMAARRHRAESLWNLALAEWRLGHGDAAVGALDKADAALRAGASLGRSADETVAPDLGRALVQLALGRVPEALDALDRARAQSGGGIAYAEMLAGWIALQQGDPGAARSRFEAALSLAPDLHELDGWLSQARLAVAEAAVAEGRPVSEAAPDFDAAVRFAERAARREAKLDPRNADFAVREALARLRAVHVSERRRFESARQVAGAILEKTREERRALAVKGFANYRLGDVTGDPALFDQCLRDLQQVLDVPSASDDPLRAYARESLATVKHWLSLEEKVVAFSEPKLSVDWSTAENQGVRVGTEDGWLVMQDVNRRVGATGDGTPAEPTVVAKARKLFTRDTLETVQAWVRIPKTGQDGGLVNNVTWGIAVQPAAQEARGLAKSQGVGVFYDKGKVAVRLSGGQDPLYKDGEVHRVVKDGKELEWPDDPTGLGVLVEIERVDGEGTVVLRLGSVEVLRDRVSSFKRGKGDTELWLGGWSAKAQNWDVRVDKVRVVRRKS